MIRALKVSLGFLWLLAGSCASTIQPPPPAPPFVSVAPPCAAGTPAPPQGNMCDGKMSPDEMGCFKCAVKSGCVLADAVIYCVASCADCGKNPAAKKH